MRRILWFDGEPYYVTVPPFSLWQTWMGHPNFDIQDKDTECFCYEYTGNMSARGRHVIVSSERNRPTWQEFMHLKCLDDELEATRMPNKYAIGWRPVLVPLQKNSETIDQNLFKDEPFGTIHEGLSIFSGNGFLVKEPRPDDVIGSMVLGDTDEVPLRWVQADGMLVCTRVLGKIKAERLWDTGYISFVQNDKERLTKR